MKEELERDMTPRLIGETYMKYATETSHQRRRYGLYMCQYCGREWEVETTRVTGGYTKSCGCLIGKSNKKHGLSLSRFYSSWYAIKRRCYNSEYKAFADYGGRGITVCEEWLDVVKFIEWCESTCPNEKGISLDRIDNDKGYSPENCRWTDVSTQNINQRMRRTNTSGYVGIHWVESKLKWVSRINVEKKRIWLGDYKTIEEAAQARDNYIIENNLPHKLSTDYDKENK